MGASTTRGLSLTMIGVVGSSLLLIPACSSESLGPPPPDGGSIADAGPSIYCGTKGAACCAPAGEVPNPECDDGDESQCSSTPTTCKIAEPQCGSTSTCEPLADNTGTTKNFRMRRIILVAPPKLATQDVQNVVVNNGVDMNEPQCAEEQTGDFSWLLSFDTAAKTLTTGGAPPCDLTDTPSCDPFTTGYCFVNKTVGGIAVAPATAATTIAADGTTRTAAGAFPTLNIPIYYLGSIIVLPISSAAIEGVKLSPDGNCIGSVNTNALAADCSDDYQGCSKWLTDGSLTGYITLKVANTVQVTSLGETLCSLLTGDSTGPVIPGTTVKTCATDASGNPTDPGDYCSGATAGTTQGPSGCKDAFWLAATFAAAAVNLDPTNGNPDCQGGSGASDASPE